MKECRNIPKDWARPEWNKREKVHNWRNYASEHLISHWTFMDSLTKQLVAECLNNVASVEEWD